MTDNCIQFLQWSLPKLQMRWQGFRKVRSQVCKRISARIRALELPDFEAYRSYLERHSNEWPILDSFCRITISHFYRDREIFRFLESEVLPELCEAALAQRKNELRCWSIGCASGEEPYSLALLWDYAISRQFPSLKIKILATDADRTIIERAEQGCYDQSSLKDLPKDWIARAFVERERQFCIRQEEQQKINFLVQDIRTELPDGLFHLILCRNLVFTYFEEALQREVLERLQGKLITGGALVTGIHESLPRQQEGFEPWPGKPGVYRKV